MKASNTWEGFRWRVSDGCTRGTQTADFIAAENFQVTSWKENKATFSQLLLFQRRGDPRRLMFSHTGSFLALSEKLVKKSALDWTHTRGSDMSISTNIQVSDERKATVIQQEHRRLTQTYIYIYNVLKHWIFWYFQVHLPQRPAHMLQALQYHPIKNIYTACTVVQKKTKVVQKTKHIIHYFTWNIHFFHILRSTKDL